MESMAGHKKKLIIIISSVVCFLIIAGVLFYFLGIPQLKYHNAVKDMENGNYSSAKALFAELGNYKDAKDYITEADYQIAKQVAKTELIEGLELLEKMGSYKDSEELVASQKNRIFEAAKSSISDRLFPQAEEYLNAIADMEGVSDCKNELTFQRALDHEDKCQYGSSKSEFEKIRGYKDVDTRLNSLNYQLDGDFMYGVATGYSINGMSVNFYQSSGTLYTHWLLGYSVPTANELERNYFYRIENNIIYGVVKSENEVYSVDKPTVEIGRIRNFTKDKNGNITRIQISGLFTDEPVWFDRS